ncbi:VOC family protein [Flavobacterium sp. UBA4197]|uniref:VOC family protein n=1 Tax=Flavobacterium sp. UBA4197 TaxID=1946546 RepID=UPI00257B1BAB|nr:VOC family protein [Flavobacterium sp. UBA4197]
MKKRSILQTKAALLIGLAILTHSCNTKTESPMTPSIESLGAVQFRIARPTNNLQKVVKFYKEVIGLKELGAFSGHQGYDGVMLGLPDEKYHLEFTQHADKAPLPEPTKENLLVFYFDTPEKYEKAVQKMAAAGVPAVAPENPYWEGKSQTYEDPDQWRIIFYNGTFKSGK